MSNSNVKNYAEPGGDKWIVGGTIDIAASGKLTFQDKQLAPAEHQNNSTATTIAALTADFNALLAKLKAAGLMGIDNG